MGDRDDPDDVMETSLTIDYDKQWLNCVSAIGPKTSKILRATARVVAHKATAWAGRRKYGCVMKLFYLIWVHGSSNIFCGY